MRSTPWLVLHSRPSPGTPCLGNTLTAAAHIITAVIGAGVLALPHALAMLGW